MPTAGFWIVSMLMVILGTTGVFCGYANGGDGDGHAVGEPVFGDDGRGVAHPGGLPSSKHRRDPVASTGRSRAKGVPPARVGPDAGLAVPDISGRVVQTEKDSAKTEAPGGRLDKSTVAGARPHKPSDGATNGASASRKDD